MLAIPCQQNLKKNAPHDSTMALYGGSVSRIGCMVASGVWLRGRGPDVLSCHTWARFFFIIEGPSFWCKRFQGTLPGPHTPQIPEEQEATRGCWCYKRQEATPELEQRTNSASALAAQSCLASGPHCQDRLFRWCQGCSCHVHHAPLPQSIDDALPEECFSKSCPMRGRRSCDLATGQLWTCFAEASEHGLANLLPLLSAATADAKDRIISDYMEGVRHVHFLLQVKFGPWEDLPLVLAGLGSTDEQAARKTARHIVKLLPTIQQQSASDLHHVTRKWLCTEDDDPLPGLVFRLFSMQ